MIKYSSYSAVKNIILTGLGYYFAPANSKICATREDKILKFDGVGILSLSIDGGRNYTKTLDLTSICSIITRAKFYANGNIMWANHTKCYYSEDNLSTYHESTIVALGGGAFTPSTFDNFVQYNNDNPVIINGIEIDIWGCYSVEIGTQNDNINAWYTIDGGQTIKSCYKAGTSIGGQTCQHIHAINYCDIDDSFWMQTGDGAAGASNCHWNKGTYNAGTDTWTWVNVMSSNGGGYHKTVGMYFYNGYVYWGSDCTDGLNKGVYKCLYTEITDNTKYVKILATTGVTQGFYTTPEGVMIADEFGGKQFHISLDRGLNWTKYTLTDLPDLNTTWNSYFPSMPSNNNGYYKKEIPQLGEAGRNIFSGINLMIRIK